ncbi:MAG: FAD-dependent oxidoreductase, partial [Bacillota bacterium]
YLAPFLAGCAESGIPTEVIGREETLALEPLLNPAVRLAVRVPDGVLDPFRLVAAFVATAQANGARVLPFSRVVGFVQNGGGVSGVRLVNDLRGSAMDLKADLVINATGPSGGKVAAMAGARVPVMPSAGVMVALDRRLNRRVVNRLRKPGDGDIIVPQRATSLIGTTSWNVDELEPVPVPRDHVVKMVEEGARLIPAVKQTPIKASFSSARPLVSGNLESDGREVSRGFQIFDHGHRDGVPGLISVSGGKTTTSRAMAEHVGNLVCRLTGRDISCRTAEVPLVPYYHYRLLGGLPEARREAVAP